MSFVEPVTERQAEAQTAIDLLPTIDLVELINAEDALVAGAVAKAIPALATAIDAVVERLRGGGRLVYVGAGSSGRLAAVDAAELGSTFGVEPGLVTVVAAEDDAVEDDETLGAAESAATRIGPPDAVVALSASGETPYVVAAARHARAAGALVIAVTCVDGSSLARLAEHEIAVVVGPEVVAGSTRMKAGTAQKLVLNTVSTVSMIRLGKTYGNLMVGVVASNAKLRARMRRAVGLATGAPPEEVEAKLDAAGGDAKVAIVSLLAGVDTAEARDRLDAAGGVVREALQ